jgi:uncharacterized integral membrane protein
MRRLAWRLLFLGPLLLLAVVFALSNAEPVRLDLWPTDMVFVAPLSLLMLGAMGMAFLAGALATWFSGIGARMRARRAERTVVALRAELDAAQSRLARAEQVPAVLPPAPTPAPARTLALH